MKKFKDVLYIFSSNVIIFCMSFVKGFLVPGYLGPSMYGIVSLLNLVKTVLGFSALGVDQAYLRLSLAKQGANEPQSEIDKLQNTTYCFLTFMGICGGIVTVVLPLLYPRDDPELQKIMVFAFSATALQHVFVMIGGFFNSTCVIRKKFVFISRLNVLQTFLNLAILLSTVFVWKIYGVFLAELIAVLTVQIIYIGKTGIRPTIKLDWEDFKKVIRYAIPFSLTSISFYFARMIDKTIILIYLTMGELGLYTFAMNLSTHTRMIYKSVAEVFSPYFIEEVANHKNVWHLSEKVKFHTLCIAALSGFIAVNVIVFGDVIRLLLPKYADSIIILKLLIINSYVSTITVYQSLLLGSPNIRKQNLLNGFMLLAGVANTLISIGLIKMGLGIVGVAWGTLSSMILWQICVFSAAHRYYLQGRHTIFYLKLALPVIIMIVMVFGAPQKMIWKDPARILYFIMGNGIIYMLFKVETSRVWFILTELLIKRIGLRHDEGA